MVDYLEGKIDVDWIKNVNLCGENGLIVDNQLGINGLISEGKVVEMCFYLCWEELIFGINGEGCVSLFMFGCQVIIMVIDKDGNMVVYNEIWMILDVGGIKGFDYVVVQLYIVGCEVRICESCYNNLKVFGYGILGGWFMKGYDKGFMVDLEMVMGEIILNQIQVQSQVILSFDYDFSWIVIEDGKQLVIVGLYWLLIGLLLQEICDKMECIGLCMGCYQNMIDEDLWFKVNSLVFVINEEYQVVMDEVVYVFVDKKSV